MRILKLLAALAVTVHANAAVIDVPPPASTVGPFSDTDIATWGQTWVSPVDGVLTDFSFLLDITDPGEFQFFVATWSVDRAASIIYSSPVQVAGAGLSTYTWTPNVPVDPGATYVSFVNNSSFRLTGNFLNAGIAYAAQDYPSGALFFQSTGLDFGQITAAPWFNSGLDAAFRAEFTAVPENANASLLAGIALVLGLVLRRSLKAPAE